MASELEVKAMTTRKFKTSPGESTETDLAYSRNRQQSLDTGKLADSMFSRFYQDLRHIAHHIFRYDGTQTRQPTELVDDFWIKVRKSGVAVPEDPEHFQAFAAQGIRWLFKDYLRKRGRKTAFEQERAPRFWNRAEERDQHETVDRLQKALDRLRKETRPERKIYHFNRAPVP